MGVAKRAVVAAFARPLQRRHGLSTAGARLWARAMLRDLATVHLADALTAHARGHTRATRTLERRAHPATPTVPLRDYLALRPLNAGSGWLHSRIAAAATVPGLADRVPTPLVLITRSGGRVEAVALTGSSRRLESADLADLVRERGELDLVPVAWGGVARRVSWDERGLRVDDVPVSADDLAAAMTQHSPDARMLLVDPRSLTRNASAGDAELLLVRVYAGRRDGAARVLDAEVVTDASIPVPLVVDEATGRLSSPDGDVVLPGSEIVVRDIERLLSHPRAEFAFISLDLVSDGRGGYVIVEFDDEPPYPRDRLFSDAAATFLLDLHRARADERASRSRALRGRTFLARARRRTHAFALRTVGFTGAAARAWVGAVTADRRDRQDGGPSARRLRRLHRWGFTATAAAALGVTAADRHRHVSPRDHLYAQPFNGGYGKWIHDRVSTLMVFQPFVDRFEKIHYQFVRQGGELRILAISAEARRAGVTVDGIAQVLARSGELVLQDGSWEQSASHRVTFDGSAFLVDDVPSSPGAFLEFVRSRTPAHSLVLVASRESRGDGAHVVSVEAILVNADGVRPVVAEAAVVTEEPGSEGALERRAYPVELASGALSGGASGAAVPQWDEIVATLQRLGAFAPQLRLVQFDIAATSGAWWVRRVSATPRYRPDRPFSDEVAAFVRARVAEKRRVAVSPWARLARGGHNAKLKLRRDYAALVFPRGFVPYQAVRWPADVVRDLLQRTGVSLPTKLWAYRHGYLSYRVLQYDLATADRRRLISDFEYRWLRHINDRYKHWLEDKVSIKYVAAPFSEHLPAYYYSVARGDGRDHVVPLMDCPQGFGAELDDVLRLARDKGRLALKPDQGSHGAGFYRLEWTDGRYLLNGEPATDRDIAAVLTAPGCRYLVTEFIEMHPVLATIYPHSVNTVRLIVFKPDGVTPRLGNAYLRIGTTASGFVDNTAAGGIVARIDPDTGAFGDAHRLRRGRLVACDRHPDTGAPIEGVIPHWDMAKRGVLRMAEGLSQLEYLGFDVAVTEDGFRVPEINRFPDYPRIDRLTPDTTEYLLDKLEQKKRRYGYDVRRPRTLVGLPPREAR